MTQDVRSLKSSHKFKWTDQALNYLGTLIPAELSHTFELHFPPPLHTVRILLKKWHRGFHSRFLYLFQVIPIAIPMQYLKWIHTLFTEFIWAHRHPRIRRSLLTLPKQYGGLAISDLHKYYQAAHLSRMIDWCQLGDLKTWPSLEQAQSIALLI